MQWNNAVITHAWQCFACFFFLFGACSEFEATKGQSERSYKYLFIKHIKERIESLREKKCTCKYKISCFDQNKNQVKMYSLV